MTSGALVLESSGLMADGRGLKAVRRFGGMTLVELLIAFMIFLMMVGALVGLTTRSLDTWQQGERRKAVYDKAQVVLDMISRDIRNTFVENEVVYRGNQELQPAAFACDYDRSRRPRIRFVRTGNPAIMRVPGGGGGGGGGSNASGAGQIIAQIEYTDLFEVAYILHPKEGNAVLMRGTRRFNRNTSYSILDPEDYEEADQSAFEDYFEAVETGVIYVGYKFWTQHTTTWDDRYPITKTSAKSSKPSGPELRWDSTRREDRHFEFNKRPFDPTNPDFVYPEIVRITVTIETTEPERHSISVASTVDSRSRMIQLTHTNGMPDGPGLALIENEWVVYGAKTSTALLNCVRGARRTKEAGHAKGAVVRFGETFTTDVRISTYREAQEP